MTPKSLLALLLPLVVLASWAVAAEPPVVASNLVSWPAPPGVAASPDYTLEVAGQPVFVYPARVRSLLQPREDGDLVTQRALTPPERAAFAIFDLRGPVAVAVRPARPFTSARILPARAGMTPTIREGVIHFQITEPRHLTVVLDGSSEQPLHLLISAPETEIPMADDPQVRYFGPGVHEVGQLHLKSGQTLYLAGGAILRPTLPPDAKPVIMAWSKLPAYQGNVINVYGAKGVRIAGRGIIDATTMPRHGWTMITVARSEEVTISGITLLDAAGWNVNLRRSSNLRVENLRLIGARLNSDGIDLVNCQKVTVRHCFVRSHDDGIIAKSNLPDEPGENLTIEDCQVWDDWGYALGVSYETLSPIRAMRFRRCDVLYARHWAMGVHVSDSATISDIQFEDIVVHTSDAATSMGGHYAGLAKSPKLLRLIIKADMWGKEPTRGQIRDITLHRVTMDGPIWPVELLGFSDAHTVAGVRLVAIRQAGRPTPLGPKDLPIIQNAYVSGVELLAEEAPGAP